MANIENVKLAIQVMERATNLDMMAWQNGPSTGQPACSIEELHTCGNTACFAGYLAVSGIPGWSTYFGVLPKYGEYLEEAAVMKFLDISHNLAYALVYGEYGNFNKFYPVPFSEVTPEHVIEKLNLILTGELQ